jgi:hypothetical protein
MGTFNRNRKIYNNLESRAFWYDTEGNTKVICCRRCEREFNSKHRFNKLCDCCNDFAKESGLKRQRTFRVMLGDRMEDRDN